MKLYLIRHGEAVTNAEKRLPTDDTSLTEKGVEQARLMADYLRQKNIKVLYSSRKKRAVQTANIIAEKLKCAVLVRDGLGDYSFGVLAGRMEDGSDAEVNQIFAEREKGILDYRIQGGENFHDLQKRVLPVVEEILGSKEKAAVIVGHLYVNRIILAHILGMTLRQSLGIKVPNDCIYHFDTENKQVQHYWNGETKQGLLRKE
ncbi:histidine phosphatase family protein [Candidatus Woesearchaeota archaeon]|nr:histidine phosphatase family protein [Candidatus Woesearchaeota archaeon]